MCIAILLFCENLLDKFCFSLLLSVSAFEHILQHTGNSKIFIVLLRPGVSNENVIFIYLSIMVKSLPWFIEESLQPSETGEVTNLLLPAMHHFTVSS